VKQLFILIACVLEAACVAPMENRNGRSEFIVTPEARQALESAPLCCASSAQFSFEPLRLGERLNVKIDAARPAFESQSGKSYFLAYRLPDSTTPVMITIRSWFHGTAFFPSALLLDSEFAQKRFITSPEVHYVVPGFFERGHVEANIRVDPGEGAAYLVVLTTEADMHKQMASAVSSTVVFSGKSPVFVPGGGYANDYGPTGSLRIDVSAAADTAK
jgi:maltose operon periplasmic protein